MESPTKPVESYRLRKSNVPLFFPNSKRPVYHKMKSIAAERNLPIGDFVAQVFEDWLKANGFEVPDDEAPPASEG